MHNLQIATCFSLNCHKTCHTLRDSDELKLVFRRVRKKRPLTSPYPLVCPSVHMEQLSSQWRDFPLIWHLRIFFSKMWRKKFKFDSNLTRIICIYMQTYAHLWQYLDEFSSEWEIFHIKILEKIKTNNWWSITFFSKSRLLWDNVDKYGAAGQTAKLQYNAAQKRCKNIWHMLTQTLLKLCLFHGNSGYANASQFYVIHTLLVLL